MNFRNGGSMKRAGTVFAFAAVSVLAIGLTGCGSKPTAQSLASKASSNLENVESLSMEENLVFDGDISSEGMTVNMGMEMDLTLDMIQSPMKGHLLGEVSLSMLGEEYSTSVETYVEESDDKLVTYTSADEGDWEMSEEDLDENDLTSFVDGSIYSAIADGDIEAELAEETEVVNDKDAYVLTFTLEGEQLEEVMNDSFAQLSETDVLPEDTDWDTVSADSTLYLYKESGLPARLEMDCKDLGQAMMASMMGAEEMEDVTIEVNQFDITVNIPQYDNVVDFDIPEEAKGASDADSTEEDALSEFEEEFSDLESEAEEEEEIEEDIEDSQEEDGFVTVTSGTLEVTDGVNTATVGIPEGFTSLTQISERYVVAQAQSYADDASVYFASWYDTPDEYLEDAVSTDYMDEDYSDVEVGDTQTVTVGEYEVLYRTMDYVLDGDTYFHEYFCCAEVGGEFLAVEIECVYGEGEEPGFDDSAIEAVYSAITVQ